MPQEGGRTGTMAVAKPRARLIEESAADRAGADRRGSAAAAFPSA